MSGQIIVTIGRQFGSGGREIGEKLATKLGIGYFDRRLIEEAAKAHGMSEAVVETYDEKPTGRFAFTGESFGLSYLKSFAPDMPLGMQVALAQFNAIRAAAKDGSCVIIGRCADFVLSGQPNVVNVFIHAAQEKRIERICARHQIAEEDAKRALRTVDRRRAAYYNYYTDRAWGDMTHYHMTLDSGELGVDGCAAMIERYVQLRAR